LQTGNGHKINERWLVSIILTMAAYLSGIAYGHDGYLLLPEHPDQEVGVPFVLESVQQLWLKFHPHKDSIDFEASSEPEDLPPLEKLERFSDMTNKLLPVIEDINRMRDCERFLTKKQRDEREKRIMEAERTSKGKVKSLEREQAARLQTKSEFNPDGVPDYTDATQRMVKTLNSIRLIYPLLINMLNHEFRNDVELKIGKQTIDGGGRGTKRAWLLGDYVSDLGSKKNLHSIRDNMSHVLRALLPADEVSQIMKGNFEWKGLAKRCLARSDIPESAPNPLKLLNLSEDLLSKARQHDVALMNYIGEGRQNNSQHAFSQAVGNLKRRLDKLLGNRFQGCRLEVYGSCLSDLSIGKASDVDISIHIPLLKKAKLKFEKGLLSPARYESEVKTHVYRVTGSLKDGGRDFFDIQAVARARVPVVKGCYRFAENPYTQDGSLCFDICFFNDIAVRNSTLLRDYTEVDPRSKDLMLAVKKWAKEHKICSAADERMSSYAWVVLVIFYLQQIDILPNLQSEDLMKATGFKVDPTNNSLHYINALNTAFVPWYLVKKSKAWQQPEEIKNIPVSVLLHGFFHFLSTFPSAFYAVSMRTESTFIPKSSARNCSLSFLCIEDPFETFVSHCPHDLAGPVSWKGQVEITALLAEGEKYARSVLLQDIESKVGELWVTPERVKKQVHNGKGQTKKQTQNNKDSAKNKGKKQQAANKPQNRHPPKKNNRQPQKTQAVDLMDVDVDRDHDMVDVDPVDNNNEADGGKSGSKNHRGKNHNRSKDKSGNQKEGQKPETSGEQGGGVAKINKKPGKEFNRGKPRKKKNPPQPNNDEDHLSSSHLLGTRKGHSVETSLSLAAQV
jgi:hypothetical protein